jgi:hypothetical protein
MNETPPLIPTGKQLETSSPAPTNIFLANLLWCRDKTEPDAWQKRLNIPLEERT